MQTSNPSAHPFGIATVALAAAVITSSAAAGAATLGGLRPMNPGFMQSDANRPDALKPLLYVGDNANNQISVFHVNKIKNPQPFEVIKQGLSGPQGMTTDKAGNLYVANLYGNNVTIYAHGATLPKATLSYGLSSPTDVHVDSSGNVYVSNAPGLGAPSFIEEFPAGQTMPSYLWRTPQANQDISGFALLNPAQPGQTSIYAAYYTLNASGFATGGVFSCYPGNTTCVNTGFSFGQTGGLVVAESPGLAQPFDWLIVDQYVPGFDNVVNNSSMTQTVTGGTPEFMALNAKKTQLFVSDRFYGRVIEYSYPGGKALNTFTPAGGSDTKQVYGVAVSPAGTYF